MASYVKVLALIWKMVFVVALLLSWGEAVRLLAEANAAGGPQGHNLGTPIVHGLKP